jgi:uncharacterized membrane protein
MPVDVQVEAVIQRPVDQVAAFAGDPANAPRWYANIRSAVWETPPPMRLGSKVTFTARFLGRDLTYTYEVDDWQPGRRLVMRTAQGPFPMRTTYTWESVGDGATRMTLRNDGQPAGFGRVAAPLMAAAMRRETTKDLARLKALLEGT